MQRHPSPPPIEVWCNHCDTSFAAGTKRCVHCGNRLAKQRVPRVRFGKQLELPPELQEDLLVEEDVPKRKSPISPFTLVWIAVLVGGYVFQLCAQR